MRRNVREKSRIDDSRPSGFALLGSDGDPQSRCVKGVREVQPCFAIVIQRDRGDCQVNFGCFHGIEHFGKRQDLELKINIVPGLALKCSFDFTKQIETDPRPLALFVLHRERWDFARGNSKLVRNY